MSELGNCLGVSLGSRRIGLAVGNTHELILWQLKMFPGTYSKKKVKKIWRAIEQWIKEYDVQNVAFKLPPKVSFSDGLHGILKELLVKCEARGLRVECYTLEAIDAYCTDTGKRNKKTLAEQLAGRYPELKREYLKLTRSQDTMKIFEAVGALETILFEA